MYYIASLLDDKMEDLYFTSPLLVLSENIIRARISKSPIFCFAPHFGLGVKNDKQV